MRAPSQHALREGWTRGCMRAPSQHAFCSEWAAAQAVRDRAHAARVVLSVCRALDDVRAHAAREHLIAMARRDHRVRLLQLRRDTRRAADRRARGRRRAVLRSRALRAAWEVGAARTRWAS